MREHENTTLRALMELASARGLDTAVSDQGGGVLSLSDVERLALAVFDSLDLAGAADWSEHHAGAAVRAIVSLVGRLGPLWAAHARMHPVAYERLCALAASHPDCCDSRQIVIMQDLLYNYARTTIEQSVDWRESRRELLLLNWTSTAVGLVARAYLENLVRSEGERPGSEGESPRRR